VRLSYTVRKVARERAQAADVGGTAREVAVAAEQQLENSWTTADQLLNNS